MKKFIFILLALFSPLLVLSQSPQQFNYQAIYRDVSGNIKPNENVAVVISIIQGAVDGTEVFSETHIGTTNKFGLLTLTVGAVNTSGFSSIDWSDGSYYLKININGSAMGTIQLLSVPYALHAKTAESVLGSATETDPVFTTSPAADISEADKQTWNTAYGWGDHADQGYLGFSPDLSNSNYMLQVFYPNLLFKGKLHDLNNDPLSGVITMSARLYDAALGGSLIWAETIDVVFQEGYFELHLGEITPFDEYMFTLPEIYLELIIGGESFDQRVKLKAVSKAYIADKAYSLVGSVGMGDGSGLDADLFDGYDSPAFLKTVDFQDHTHDASDIAAGIVDFSRLPVGTHVGTIAEGEHTHSASDINGVIDADLYQGLPRGYHHTDLITASSSIGYGNDVIYVDASGGDIYLALQESNYKPNLDTGEPLSTTDAFLLRIIRIDNSLNNVYLQPSNDDIIVGKNQITSQWEWVKAISFAYIEPGYWIIE